MFFLGQCQLFLSWFLVNSREVAAAAPAVADMKVKVPAHNVAPKSGPWTTSREPVSLWGGEIDGKTKKILVVELCTHNLLVCYFIAFRVPHKAINPH